MEPPRDHPHHNLPTNFPDQHPNYYQHPYHPHPHPHHQHHHHHHHQHPPLPPPPPPPQFTHPLPFQPQFPPYLPPPPPPPPPQPINQYFNRHEPFVDQNYDHNGQFSNPNFDIHSNFDCNHPLTAPPNEPFGGGFFSHGRKRGRNHPVRPDHNGDAAFVKLFVAPVPVNTTIENIRPLFEVHGSILEIILPRDKRSGQQQGYCFVKYATIEEADRAINALNGQYTIPGEVNPLKVRYADKERERIAKVEKDCLGERFAKIEKDCLGNGECVDKLYVGCINKQASKQEIEEIFSPYGPVEDVYIVRDYQKQSRGCAFVKLPHRDMAVAAIKALHGTFMMRGCDQPLIVKFADPKKPRAGELRENFASVGQDFGPCSQESSIRPTTNSGDPMGGLILPDASYHLQDSCTNAQSVPVANTVNLGHAASQIMKRSLSPEKQPPPQLSQSPSQQTKGPQKLLQSSEQAVTEMTKQTHNLGPQQISHISLESQCSGDNPPSINDSSIAPSVLSSPHTEDPQECDWSEHRCPDGYKYYYNCTTCESRWEKPDELTLFQQQLKKKQKMNNLSQPPHSLSRSISVEESNHTSSIRNSTPALLPVDSDHRQIKAETGHVVDPTCV